MILYSLCLYVSFIRSLRQYSSDSQKLVNIPFIDSNLLSILQLLELKFSEIDKRGCSKKIRGVGKSFRKLIRLSLGTKE